VTGDYTIAAISATVAVVAVEVTVLRTGILRRPRFWGTIAITLGFQVAVDGWLTKLSAPIVLYRQAAISGARWPWDIPVQDFGFAFAMITMTLALWELGTATRSSTPLGERPSGVVNTRRARARRRRPRKPATAR
jgi:lycopene cyclase domain-containing protein